MLSLRQFLKKNRFEPRAGVRQVLPDHVYGSVRQLLTYLNYWHVDRLDPKQQLVVGDRLVARNGLFQVMVRGEGNLVLHRTHFGRLLWASNTEEPVDRFVMQSDGNFVAFSSEGIPYWSTSTTGHPGAYLLMQTDGNLVVYDSANNPLWASNTAQDLSSPTYRYSDEQGYEYCETAEGWKAMCRVLPCFIALQWPDYASAYINATIDGKPVVIQLWKGWCQKFLGMEEFPGGIGAEVGVYERVPGKVLSESDLKNIPWPLASLILSQVKTLSDEQMWWPVPYDVQIEFTLINPRNGREFFSAGPEQSYWLAKWMLDDSYDRYKKIHDTPLFSVEYMLDYKINGRPFPRW